MASKKVIVKQVRSSNRCDKRHLDTLQALGLGRIGREKEHLQTPATLGMIKAVSHLVVVHESGK